ncbi:MAG TPA: zinc-dependent alcohol dehydrogenase family protein [Chloroflexota bacterium]
MASYNAPMPGITQMRAQRLHAQASIDDAPLQMEGVDVPSSGPSEIVIEVEACGLCRTDLHVIEGDLPPVKMPIIPGHQVVGRVVNGGDAVRRFSRGDRAGIAWLRYTDGTCPYCTRGAENLCPNARFTGYMADGGYAEYALVDEAFAYHIPQTVEAVQAAPLLCAGIIGYRALKRSEIKPGHRLGMYGFGASAHVSIQVARHWGCEVYVATRGERHRALAREMGAVWVGNSADSPPVKLDSAIIFAPAGELVPVALEALDRGGTLALAGIYMTDVPPLDYERHLFYERSIRSVTANTRDDGRELLRLAAEVPIRTHVETFALEQANDGLQRLKHDSINGAGVLVPARG